MKNINENREEYKSGQLANQMQKPENIKFFVNFADSPGVIVGYNFAKTFILGESKVGQTST